jgi:uncharacterized protein YidB (DUF937 family)
MSLLDSVIGALANAQPGAQPPSPGATQGTPGSVLLSTVISMLANGQHPQGAGVGGLGDLIGRFAQGGMGDVIGSWIGHGQNAPISGDQLSNVLGSDVIGQIASQLGRRAVVADAAGSDQPPDAARPGARQRPGRDGRHPRAADRQALIV